MAARRNNYQIVIPARYASERLPGKVLLDLAGKPLLQHVWQRANESAAESVLIATDDERVVTAAKSFGAEVLLTRSDHRSGSDRIAECADQLDWPDNQLVVNLQADEPLMPASCLDQVADMLVQKPDCDVASLYWPITDAAEVLNPNTVKVVTTIDGHALYFSRSPIPYERGHADVSAALTAGQRWRRHLGLYAYRLSALRYFTAMPPGPLELAESLEQLRVMEHGGHIAMARANEFIPAGIDTSEDLDRVRKFMQSNLSL